MQEITTYKGDRFIGFTEVIDDFIQRGRLNKLLVKLTLFLHENQASDDEISNLLEDIISYKDEIIPSLAASGKSDAVEEENRLKRLEVLQHTIGKIIPSGEPIPSGELGVELEPAPQEVVSTS